MEKINERSSVNLVCTILPVGRQVTLNVPEFSSQCIRVALSKELLYETDAFDLFVRSGARLVALEDKFACHEIYALLRCRGGGKGGFRKQLEKKGREFARAKMKERRSNIKAQSTVREVKPQNAERSETRHTVKKSEIEYSATRALVKQGLGFMIEKVHDPIKKENGQNASK